MKYVIEYPFKQKNLQYTTHSYPLHKFYDGGMCLGVCMEYGRRHKLEEDITIFRKELSSASPYTLYEFLKRITIYHPTLQTKEIVKTYDTNVHIDYKSNIPFIDGFPPDTINSHLLGINWSYTNKPFGHIILMKNYNCNKKMLYTFFDPNLGETYPFYKSEMNSVFRKLLETIYPTATNFSITNVEAVIEKYVINGSLGKVYVPPLPEAALPQR